MKRLVNTSITVAVVATIAVAGAVGFVYSGLYNIGADDHHTEPVLALMQTLRDRSIEAHSQHISVPDLEDPQLILKGAGQYAAMCTQCHLKPGMEDSEIRPGLYPQPPNLSKFRPDPREAFWVIKHGIKMSAMPAWGGSHDDATIWSMVAFLQKLPGMTSAEYEAIVARAPPDDDMAMDHAAGHSHEPQAEPGHAGSALPATAGSVEGAPVAPASVAQPASVAAPASVSPPGRG
jgi:mono/diheme cytochrome c family protein